METKLLLVDVSLVPSVFLKVLQAKRLLSKGVVKSSSDACKAVGISRSAFYKYKDGIFAYEDQNVSKTVTLYLRLSDDPGVLSSVLSVLYQYQANILTVNHSREDRDSEVGACIVSLVLETRNSDHVAAIKLALTDAGYPLLHNS